MTLVEEYFQYVEQYVKTHGPKTLILMQVGHFFECYGMLLPNGSYKGSHIQQFASINDMAIAKKNMFINGLEVFMAGFGLTQLEKYVKKMLDHGYTVPVFVQDMQAKNTTRSLAYIYSPGTYFNMNESINTGTDDDQGDQGFNNACLSNNTICIWVNLANANNVVKEATLTIGLSIIDILTGKLINYEYNHPYIDSPTTYDQLEKYIAIYNPSEVIIIANTGLVSNDLANTNLWGDKTGLIDKIISYANIHAQKFHKIYLDGENENIRSDATEFLEIAKNYEKQRFQEALIDKIYGQGSFSLKAEFREYPIANQSLCFLLDFIYKHNPSLIKDIDYPIFENHCNKLVLANHSLKQLNIISDQRYNGKLSCVANFLNNCITNSGKRKFNYELLHPISEVTELEKSYAIIDHLIETGFYTFIKENMTNVRDIEKIERKLIMKNINPKDFSILYSVFSNIRDLFKKISTEKSNEPFYKYIKSYIDSDVFKIASDFMTFIEERFNIYNAAAIVMDKLPTYDLDKLNFINKKYSKDLNVLFKNSMDSREQLNSVAHFFSGLIADFEKPKNKKVNKKVVKDDLANESDIGSSHVKIHETSKSDPILLLTKRRAIILKEIIEKMIETSGQHYEIQYKSTYTGLVEVLSLDLAAIEYKVHGNNNSTMIICSGHINDIAHSIQHSKDILITSLTHNYGLIQEEFIKKNKELSGLSIISRFIGLVDVCHCKAYNAVKHNYCRPKIFDTEYTSSLKGEQNSKPNSYVSFKKMRHCLIEHLNNNELYVTNDLVLGDMVNGILLYGTNAVGKTSFIKSIGISLIMAQAGMYVPCQEFMYYPYEYLFTRILGNDNIFKGLSTFAVEMCELRTILKHATRNSIILGDELCSGTESTSALSIFVSSLEKLHSIESTFLFATHFHEILEYNEIKALTNMKTYHMSVIFDKKKNSLIYDRKLKEGPGEAMYGLEVCKSLDLPEEFIDRAYQIRNKYSKTGSKVIETKKSRYNAKKVKERLCEICNLNPSSDVHHLQHQKNASKLGIIDGEFHKNKKANLVCICEDCHLKIHNSDTEYRKVKTTEGYELLEI